MPTPVRQLLSRTIYDTDGSTTDWEFAFSGGYLSTSHVKASVTDNGVTTDIPVNPAMLSGLFTLRIVPALATGQLLTIYRDTPKDLPLVDFTDEAGFTEIALDTNAKQAVFVAAEATDAVGVVSTSEVLAAAITAEQAAAQAQAAALAAAADAASVNAVLGLVAGYTVAIRASGNGTQTVFPVGAPQGNISLNVYIGGVYQQRNTYTYTGGTVTFTEAPVAGSDNIEFVLTVAQPLEQLTQLTADAEAAAALAQAAANSIDVTGINSHVASTANPHNTTKAQVGLGNVDNTSDADKPVSTAQAAAIAAVAGAKQDTLVSGTNIKTINGTSLLGSGNLTLAGGGGITLPIATSDVSGLDAKLAAKASLSGAEFTGEVFASNITAQGTYPTFRLYDYDSPTDKKNWRWSLDGGTYRLENINDAFNAVVMTPVIFDSSGNTSLSGANNRVFGSLAVNTTNGAGAPLDVYGSSILRGDINGYMMFMPKFGTNPFGADYDRLEIRVPAGEPYAYLGTSHGGTAAPRNLILQAGNFGAVDVGLGRTQFNNIALFTQGAAYQNTVTIAPSIYTYWPNSANELVGGTKGAAVVKFSDNNWYFQNFDGNTVFQRAGFAPTLTLDQSGGATFGGFVSSPNSKFHGANFVIGDESTVSAGTYGFTNGNGPGIVAWGNAAAGAGMLEFTSGGNRLLDIKPSGKITHSGGVADKHVDIGAGTTIDLNTGNYFTRTGGGAINISNATGATAFVLNLINGVGTTFGFAPKWPGGTAPTFTASGRDVLGFFTHDGGTTWTGFMLGKDVK